MVEVGVKHCGWRGGQGRVGAVGEVKVGVVALAHFDGVGWGGEFD